MRIVHIEPTPSPNSMKVNLDTRLPDGERHTYTKDRSANAPDLIRRLLAIPGIEEVFHTADFMAIERTAKADWQAVLQAVRQAFGDASTATKQPEASEPHQTEAASIPQTDHFGGVQVFVQQFRGIPMQIRVTSENQEERVAMPSRFIDAVMQAQYGSPNLIKERNLVDYGVRYGDCKEIAEQVLLELEAAYDEERVKCLVAEALDNAEGIIKPELELEEISTRLDDPNWKVRYAALEKIKPEIKHVHLIEKALSDDNFSIRRLATVYLGDIKDPVIFPLLYRMLEDSSASVRRTAGDCLSDIGDADAIIPMCKALSDPSKIVRWRAARYLYEVGDERALDALHKAINDPEFEVSMQVQYAIARIEGGDEAAGSVWQQMTRRER